MDTLYAIGMMIGLMKGPQAPAKPAATPPAVEQHQAVAEKTDKTRPRQKSEWLLSY